MQEQERQRAEQGNVEIKKESEGGEGGEGEEGEGEGRMMML